MLRYLLYFFGSLFASAPLHAELVRSVDENGVIHIRSVNSKAPKNASPQQVRQQRWAKLIRDTAERHNIPHALLDSIVWAESGYDPKARSHRGAVGLMQLMPAIARSFGAKDRTDPRQNLEAGARFLSHLLQRYKDDLGLVLAAYNAGETAVSRYGDQIPPFRETQNYVQRILQRMGQWQQASLAGL